MKYQIDHDYHIHSQLSRCSNDPAQTLAAILAYAERNHFREIVLTDHFWDSEHLGSSSIPFYDPQNYEHIRKALPLPQGKNTRFYFGCETEMRNDTLEIGVSDEVAKELDFIIVPTTHMHMPFFDHESPSEIRANAWIARFDALLKSNLPFRKTGFAHLACDLIDNHTRDGALRVLRLIPDAEYARLFTIAAKLGLGIELNASDLVKDESQWQDLFRPYRIAKDCGCKFYLGSDAHHPKSFESAIEKFRCITEQLALTEEDKFRIPTPLS